MKILLITFLKTIHNKRCDSFCDMDGPGVVLAGYDLDDMINSAKFESIGSWFVDICSAGTEIRPFRYLINHGCPRITRCSAL